MFPSQVKDSDVCAHFNVKAENELYAVNEKGHRSFLTDLRVLYAREKTNEATRLRKQEQNKLEKTELKRQLTEAAQDLYVELDRTYPEYEVIMRKSQPGIELPEFGLKVYCIASILGKHVVSFTSKQFEREFLEESFSDEKIYKKSELKQNSKDITLPTNDFNHLINTINRMIMIHKTS